MSEKIFRRIISTNLAPKAVGPYVQAVMVDNVLYVSGVLGLDPKTQQMVEGGTLEEAKQAFNNVKSILEAANSSLGNVVKATILLTNIEDFGDVNEIYKQYFEEPYPARTVSQAAKLPKDAKIIVEVVAMVGEMVTCVC